MTCSARGGKKFHGGASHTAPNPTPRKGVTAIMLRIRLRRYRDALGKNIQRRVRRVISSNPPPLRACARQLQLLNSFALTPVHAAIGYCGASDIERTGDSSIGKPFIKQRTHSSLERFAKADRVLA